MPEDKLSDIEQELYDYVKKTKLVTFELIKEQLGNKHIRAVSRLMRRNLVKIIKRKIEDRPRYVKVVVIKKNREN